MPPRRVPRSLVRCTLKSRCLVLDTPHTGDMPHTALALLKQLSDSKDIVINNRLEPCGCTDVLYWLTLEKLEKQVDLFLIPPILSASHMHTLCQSVCRVCNDQAVETPVWLWQAPRACLDVSETPAFDRLIIDLLISKSIQSVEIDGVDDCVTYVLNIAKLLMKTESTTNAKPRSKALLEQDKANIWANQLLLVTGISEDIAKGLVEQ
eukprot:Blabericola_migrator_1__1359@NODE_1352_length_4741_cov_210_371202_g907_i0_p2_GENE_NODE_1352_length_4741_cov_210_371202_g907_i0NODE_1352_length_4741_cov_210_371202_g907_i0_p2_ORF_typecomplete_len208_score42_50_NODE_1352_length_4741_cov_210_371202_g907_i06991322